MGTSIILFELPVYICDEETYYNKWLLKKNAFIEHQIKTGGTEEDANDSFLRCYRYNYLWDYNKIIGFVRIEYDSRTGDIRFKIFKQDKNMIYSAINKMKFKEIYGPNLHIYVQRANNNDVVRAIKAELDYIKDSFFDKNFIETNSFNYFLKYIDFEKMIMEYDNYRK